MELFDIEGSVGTVPRQESVPKSSMQHRELYFKMALLVCLRSLAAPPRVRRAGKIKNMMRGLARN